MKTATRMIAMLVVLAMAFVIAPQAKAQTVLLTESWENGGSIPANWGSAVVSGSTLGLTYVTAGSSGYPTVPTPFQGSYVVRYNSWGISSGSTRLYRTTSTSSVGYASTSVDFAMYHDPGYTGNADRIEVQYSIDGGTTWTTAGSAVNRYNGTTGWQVHQVTLPANAGNQANLRIAFLFTSAYGNDCYLDLLHLNGIALGTLSGVVTSSVGGAPIAGASVQVNSLTPVITNATGAYSVTGLNAGVVNVTCSVNGFVTWSGTATIAGGVTTTLNIPLLPGPKISGVITDASTGLPINGATIHVGAPSATNLPVAYSIANGSYITPQLTVQGLQTIYIGKTGYDTQNPSITLTAPNTSTLSVALLPTAVQPGPFTAALNNPTNPTAVNLNWEAPKGEYQIIYDDGTQDNFVIWGSANNLNALKFTPLQWPVSLLGGKVNIGTSANYPANALPLTPFYMIAYKADGTGGVPGTKIDSVLVTPSDFGWVDFSFATPLTINSGDFYLVMKQGGIQPNACGIGVDLTNTALRSYSKYVVGGAPWIPAAGNFMMRAIVQGIGGPMLDAPVANNNQITASMPEGLIYESPVATVTGTEGTADYPAITPTYQVWRLKQGEEGNQAVWTSLWTGATTSTVDNGWPSLACGPYRWAVKAIYSPPGQRFSAPTFSNVIGKCWTANVNVCITLTCTANPKAGTIIKLTNVAYPDTTYTLTTDTSGCVHFTNVWKGDYTVTATRFTYPVTNWTVTVMGDMNLSYTLLQETAAPTGIFVNDKSLLATWNAPRSRVYHLQENWSSGSFATNQWTTSGGTNWLIGTGTGNPAPSAEFNWSPQVTNYNQYLTSKTFAGAHAPQVKLKYDIYLSNFGTTNVNTMAVELWNGTAWSVLKNYTNANGNISWTTETLDISTITNNPAFQIRFHAAGTDSYDINNWNIDNIEVYSTDGTSGPNPCVLGYNFYLNNVLTFFTPDTNYVIPPSQVVYNTTYQACVKAVYGSGYSAGNCTTFVAHFLYPARNLAVTPLECTAYLTWEKPVTSGDAPVDNAGYYMPVTQWQPSADVALSSATPTGAPVSKNNTDAPGALYDNGPMINSPGTGSGGADESVLYSPLTNYGFGAQVASGNSVADDFIVPPGAGWDVTKFIFYTYQTNAPTSGSITALHCQIYNGDPTAGGTVIWGDMTTNRLTTQSFSNIYRVNGVGGGTARAIMKTEATITGLHLNPGTYWIEYQWDGSASYSGPWAPAICITGTNVTGNGKQHLSSGWQDLLDGSYQQGLPFVIEGSSGGTTPGSTPYGLKGYKVYRGTSATSLTAIKTILSPDTLFYYDYNVNPGTYLYDVKALYDLTTYGVPTPPQPWGESLINTAGLKQVSLNCGAPLPFYEPWDQGTFAFNSWTYPTSGSHWSINTGIGNPLPSADFTWQTAITNYSQALTSEVINASAWSCASVWLDFDVKLIDRNQTGKEKLTVDVFYNNSWHQKAELTNDGTTDWISKHIDITAVKGKSFRIRFVANGVNSADIMHWYVDNIHAYGICKQPTVLHGAQSQFTTTLTWHAPDCGPSGNGTITEFIFDDGSWENGWRMNAGVQGWFGNEFPIASTTTGVLQKVKVYFVDNGSGSAQSMQVDIYNTAQTLVGSSAPFTASPVDTWIEVPLNDIPFQGKFYAMVQYNTAGNGYFFATDENGPYTAQDLGWNRDNTGAWAKASTMGSNPCVFLCRATALVNGELKAVELVPGTPMPAGVKSNAKAEQIHMSGDSFDHSKMGPLSPSVTDSSILVGYNVYRSDDNAMPPFTKISGNTPITALTYSDVHPSTTPIGSQWKYFVTSYFKNSEDGNFLCESSSDTILVVFPAQGVNELNGGLMIYPNPATELVNIKSDYRITNLEVINFAGQTVYTGKADAKTAKIDVTSFTVGVYFVKVTTTEGVRTVKITVTH